MTTPDPFDTGQPEDYSRPAWEFDALPEDRFRQPPEPEPATEAPPQRPRSTRSRAAGSDPAFCYIIAVALAVGLSPLIPHNSDLRYVVIWGVLALFGVLAWLFGQMSRIEQETMDNLIWGVVFGAIIGVPLLIVGSSALATTSRLLFRANAGGEVFPLSAGSVLAMLVFVQPLAETLFFRGVLQEQRPFWLVGLLATLWSVLLFFPMMEIGEYPLVGVVLAVALLMMNLIYSYVRHRNGLASAWVCQIVTNLILLFIPFISG